MNDAGAILRHSYDKCCRIGARPDLDAEDFVQIRMLRNEIAHEYKSETIFDIFERALALSPALLDAVKRIQQHATQNRPT